MERQAGKFNHTWQSEDGDGLSFLDSRAFIWKSTLSSNYNIYKIRVRDPAFCIMVKPILCKCFAYIHTFRYGNLQLGKEAWSNIFSWYLGLRLSFHIHLPKNTPSWNQPDPFLSKYEKNFIANTWKRLLDLMDGISSKYTFLFLLNFLSLNWSHAKHFKFWLPQLEPISFIKKKLFWVQNSCFAFEVGHSDLSRSLSKLRWFQNSWNSPFPMWITPKWK